MPAFVHSPLLPDAAKGATCGRLFHATDWLPTLVGGLVGDPARVGETDGFDQWASLRAGCGAGAGARARDSVLYDVYYLKREGGADSYESWLSAAARDEDLKLLTNAAPCDACAPTATKCACNSSGAANFLYNLTADPGESVNLIHDDAYAARRDALYASLRRHYASTLAAPRYLSKDDTRATLMFVANAGFVTEWTTEQTSDATMYPKPNASRVSWEAEVGSARGDDDNATRDSDAMIWKTKREKHTHGKHGKSSSEKGSGSSGSSSGGKSSSHHSHHSSSHHKNHDRSAKFYDVDDLDEFYL